MHVCACQLSGNVHIDFLRLVMERLRALFLHQDAGFAGYLEFDRLVPCI